MLYRATSHLVSIVSIWILSLVLFNAFGQTQDPSQEKRRLKDFGLSLKRLKWDDKKKAAVEERSKSKPKRNGDSDEEEVVRVETTLVVCALQSSEVFLSLLTKKSVSSQYVLTELGTARAFAITLRKMLVIPIVFDDIEIPDVIRDIQVLFARDQSIDDLVMQIDRAINAFIGKRVAEKEQEVEVKRTD